MANLNFIQLTSEGLSVAHISDIHAALIEEYRSIYGQDIDLSTGTADNVFIETMTQLIWNMVQAVSGLYTNMNVNDATGVYLDNLCNLSNVVRYHATASIASLVLTNLSASDQTYTDLKLFDKQGNTWTVEGTITVPGNGTLTVQATCDVLGPVKAPAGWIYQTVELTDLEVNQGVDAVPGLSDETDEQLKERKARANGGIGNTVVETLVSALTNIDGVYQAAVFSNNTGSSITASDGASVPAGGVYIQIRCPAVTDSTSAENNSVKYQIAQTIFNKLTPGVPTAPYLFANDAHGVTVAYSDGLPGIVSADTNINWKYCFGVTPDQLMVIIRPTNHFVTKTLWDIGDAEVQLATNKYLGDTITSTEVSNVAADSDPMWYGQRTFEIEAVLGDTSNSCNFFNATTSYASIEGGTFDGSPFYNGSITITGYSDPFVAQPTVRGGTFTFKDELDQVAVYDNGEIKINGISKGTMTIDSYKIFIG